MNKKIKKYFTGGEIALIKGAFDLSNSVTDGISDELGFDQDQKDFLRTSKFGVTGAAFGIARQAYRDNKRSDAAALSVQQFPNGGELLKEFKLPSHAQGGGKIGVNGTIDNVNPIAEIELNETLMNGDYVFSDRLKIDNMTFADKSKALKRKHKSNTTEAKNTLELELNDLKIKQEQARVKKESTSLIPKMVDGGPVEEVPVPYNVNEITYDFSNPRVVDNLGNNDLTQMALDTNPISDPAYKLPQLDTKSFSLFDNVSDELKPALIGKGFEAGIQALQAFKPLEQQNLYLNPEADNVRDLSNNRVDLQQLFNDQALAFNTSRNDILNNSRGQGSTLSNLQNLAANEGRSRSQLSLQQQEVDAGFNLQRANALNNLGQQEVSARLTRSDIQSANDARKRDAIRSIGSTAGNFGAFVTRKRTNDLRNTEALRLLNQISPDFQTATTIEEYKKLLAEKEAELIKFRNNESE